VIAGGVSTVAADGAGSDVGEDSGMFLPSESGAQPPKNRTRWTGG
jgi:hypothetical protein